MICDYCKNQIKECLANVTIKNFPKKNSFCNTNCMYKYQEKLKSEFVQVKREDLIELSELIIESRRDFSISLEAGLVKFISKYLKKGW